jgi:ornithine cyclodeaminase/alanine dehydrogenase-like protein (mu-crystallin family)
MPEIELLYLNEEETASAGLTMKKAIDIVERVFKAHSEGNALVPAKITLDLTATGTYNSSGNAMPAYVGSQVTGGEGICGIKWVGQNWENPRKYGLPSIFGTIILTDPETFAPRAIVGGGWVTAMRTAGATAVAVKYLAKNDSKVACIFGAGRQGRHQLLALNEILNMEEVRIVDVVKEAREKYAKEMSGKTGLEIKPMENMEEAVTGSDILITATTADEPLIKRNWVKKGCLICAIGSYQELEYQLTKSVDKIVVDHLEQTMHRGELAKWVRKGLISERDVYAELGDIVAGRRKGRESDEERILCVPIGMGSEDIAMAYSVYQLATEKGLGRRLRWL